MTDLALPIDPTSCGFVRDAYVGAMRAVAENAIAIIEEKLVKQEYLQDTSWRWVNDDDRVEIRFDVAQLLNAGRDPEEPYVQTHTLIYGYMETHFLNKGFGTHYNKVHDTFFLTFGKITKELV